MQASFLAAGRTVRYRSAQWLVGLALAGWASAGCSAVQRGRQVLSPLLEPSHAIDRPLEHPQVDAVARRLLEARAQVRRLQGGADPQRHLLLPPIAAAGTEWEASSVTWAVLRTKGALLPTPWPDAPQSPEALQAWLRQETALGKQMATELWLVQTRAGASADAELVVVRTTDIWRSGTEPLDVPAAERRSWLLTADETPPDRGLRARGAGLRGGLRPTCVSARGKSGSNSAVGPRFAPERHRSHARHDRHEWDEWDMTWVERHEERAQRAAAEPCMLSGDARLELHRRRRFRIPAAALDVGDGARATVGTAPLVRRRRHGVTSVVAAPRAWGLHDAWLVWNAVPSAAYEFDILALYSAPLRALPSPVMQTAPADTHVIRSGDSRAADHDRSGALLGPTRRSPRGSVGRVAAGPVRRAAGARRGAPRRVCRAGRAVGHVGRGAPLGPAASAAGSAREPAGGARVGLGARAARRHRAAAGGRGAPPAGRLVAGAAAGCAVRADARWRARQLQGAGAGPPPAV